MSKKVGRGNFRGYAGAQQTKNAYNLLIPKSK